MPVAVFGVKGRAGPCTGALRESSVELRFPRLCVPGGVLGCSCNALCRSVSRDRPCSCGPLPPLSCC